MLHYLQNLKKAVAIVGTVMVALAIVMVTVVLPNLPASAETTGTLPEGTDWLIPAGGSQWAAYEAAGERPGIGYTWDEFKAALEKTSCDAAANFKDLNPDKSKRKIYDCPSEGLRPNHYLRIPPVPAPAAVAPAAPLSGTLTIAGGESATELVTVTGAGSLTPPIEIKVGDVATLTITAPAPTPAPEIFEKGKGWDAPAGGLLHGVFNNNIMYVVTNGELVVTFNGTDYWGSDADTNGTFDADLGGGDGPWDFTVDDGAGSCESWHFEFGQVPAMIACGA